MTNAITPIDNQVINAEIVESDNNQLALSSPQQGFSSEDALITAWLKEKSPVTAKNYMGGVRAFLDFGGSIDTTFTTLQSWRESLSQHHKVSTANAKLAAVKSLLAFACEMGYLSYNPASKLRSIPNSKQKDKQGKAVTERIIPNSQVKQLIEAASSQRDHAMIKVCYLLGLRVHELLNLHWQDFTQRSNGAWQVKVIGKNSKQRFIGVPNDLINELRELGTEGFIFQSYQGNPLSPVAAHKLLKKTVNRAGLASDISWHWLRHCCASHSLENGASLEAVRKKLGHSNIAITGVYVHSKEDANQFIFV